MSVTNNPIEKEKAEMERAVAISTFSEMKIYSEAYRRFKKSYSCNDFEMMKAQASTDASRLRRFLSQFNDDTTCAIRQAMSMGVLKYDYILGIEGLVLEDDITIAMKRRSHAASVLKEQNVLRQDNAISCEDVANKLAGVANNSSSQCAKKARLRA
jgi:hypothetical protein